MSEPRPLQSTLNPGAGVAAWLAPLILALAIALAWWQAPRAPFVLDDHESVIGNATLADFGSFHWLRPPSTGGETVSGRPFLNFSLALDRALLGPGPGGFHVTNILIHLGAALLLWGLLRRSLAGLSAHGAAWLALAAALPWALHPLQTGAVTYVSQRAESLAALLLLLTLWCFRRSVDSPSRGGLWFAGSLMACLAAIGTKETAAAGPLLVLLYDACFLSEGLKGAWKTHGRRHLLLMACWLPLVALVWANHGRGGSAGLESEVAAWDYLLIQCRAIPHYLALAFLPSDLVFDHGVVPSPGFAAALPGLLLLAGLAAMSFWAFSRRQALGFLGVAFFVLLAPSSSFVPVATQTVAEHRMYLPLAALVLVPGILLVRRLGERRSLQILLPLSLVVSLLLGVLTFQRNEVYGSVLRLWQDTVSKVPDNARAHNNLGQALMAEGRSAEAVTEFERTLALQPNHAFAQFNLGTILLSQRRYAEAVPHFNAALQADPNYLNARINLGQALTGLGRDTEAMQQYWAALAQDPSALDASLNLAALLVGQGRAREAAERLRVVIAADASIPEAHYHLGLALERLSDLSGSEASLREALRLRPGFAAAHLALGKLQLRQGNASGAESETRQALSLDPGLAEAHYMLGNLFARQQRFEGALPEFLECLRLDPAHVPCRNNLGNCYLVLGRLREAIAAYEESLRLKPGDASVHGNLELAREALRSGRVP
jgi:tetratricopeptide (TPR) repeat protein